MARNKNDAPVAEESVGTTLAPAPKGGALATHYDESDLGSGFEDTTREDYVIPMLGILQKMSPQVDPDSGKGIEGAKAGEIINTVTQDRFDGKVGIRFIPVHRRHSFVEWIPRDQGGGFVSDHKPEDPDVLELRKGGAFGKLVTAEGNDLVETFTMYGLKVNDDGSFEQMVIPFSSTQIKEYKRWMTRANGITVLQDDRRVNPPLFAHVYRLRSKFNENNKGTWYGWEISFDGPTAEACRIPQTHELFEAAKGFRLLVKEGKVQESREQAPATAEEKDEF